MENRGSLNRGVGTRPGADKILQVSPIKQGLLEKYGLEGLLISDGEMYGAVYGRQSVP